MYCVLHGITVAFFTSLSNYTGAFAENFKSIMDEVGDEIKLLKNKKNPIPQGQKQTNDSNKSSEKLLEAILLHDEMLK